MIQKTERNLVEWWRPIALAAITIAFTLLGMYFFFVNSVTEKITELQIDQARLETKVDALTESMNGLNGIIAEDLLSQSLGDLLGKAFRNSRE